MSAAGTAPLIVQPFAQRNAWSTFRPRPDQPERYDEQTSFFKSRLPGVSFLIGGNGAGCLAAEQTVYDPVENVERPVSEIGKPFHVWARTEDGRVVVANASAPKIYGVEDLYEVTFKSGRRVSVTLGHRVWTPSGWREIGSLVRDGGVRLLPALCGGTECPDDLDGTPQSENHSRAMMRSGSAPGHPDAIEPEVRQANGRMGCTAHDENAERGKCRLAGRVTDGPCVSPKHESRWSRKQSDWTDRCSPGLRLCGGQLPSASNSDQEPSQLPADAHARSRSLPPWDDPADKSGYSRPCRCGDHLSMNRSENQEHRDPLDACDALESCSRSSVLGGIPCQSARSSISAIHRTPDGRQLLGATFPTNTIESSPGSAKVSCLDAARPIPSGETVLNASDITSVRFIRRDVYWDFSVEDHENYWMDGCWHHNTTSTAVAKVCQFVTFDQPPPRADTPFWIIAESYEQVCNSIWKEKMFGHGHLHPGMIDWERIRWYKPKQNWPFEVPLKPWYGMPGRNWSLKFKSYGQGREQMQAESIGGFMFSEQFPWGILEEVLRGCREYNFHGAKLCEFTPVDPLRSVELEEKIEGDKLPPGWRIFRSNTECAMEAGHVSKEWFHEFFGLISEDMRAVRMIGAFASFEGTIYPTFNPAVHCLPDDWEPEVGYRHFRAIDWGFGPDNAFCCLWGCRDSVGRWYIYDEYYSTDQSRTVHDHLKIIHDRWPWPAKNVWYGCTYADPSEINGIRIASKFSEYCPGYENFDMQGASNAVLDGIEHVKWLLGYEKSLGSPRLRILKSTCPNLSRQMRTYRWERGTDDGRNPQNARPQPLKKNDHAVDTLRYLVFSEANKQGIVPELKRRQRDTRRFGIQMDGRT